MAISHVLELTSGPAVVQKLGFYTPSIATVNAMRGLQPLTVQVASAGVATALPTGAVMYYGVKLPSNITGNWLANCTLTAVDPVNSPGLYRGSLELNTDPMQTALGSLLNLLCLAEIYYTLPGQADPVPSLNFNFAVGAPLILGTEGQLPSANPVWPSAAAVTTAIAEATALTASAAALPIQPPEACAAVLYRFFDPFQALDVSDRSDITYINPALIVSNALLQQAFTGSAQQNFGTNPLNQATVDGALEGLANLTGSPITDGSFSFGGAVPTGTVSFVPETYKLDFNGVNIAAIKASVTTVGFQSNYNGMPPAEGQSFTINPGVTAVESSQGVLGISDLNTAEDLAVAACTYVFGSPDYIYPSDDGDGTVTYINPNEDYPTTFGDVNSGVTYALVQAGMVPVPCANVQTLLNNGNSVTTSM